MPALPGITRGLGEGESRNQLYLQINMLIGSRRCRNRLTKSRTDFNDVKSSSITSILLFPVDFFKSATVSAPFFASRAVINT